MSSLSNKEEEKKDLTKFIQLFNKEITLLEENFDDSPDLLININQSSIGVEHTRAIVYPSINGDSLKILQSRKNRILAELKKLLIEKNIVFGQLTFTFKECLINSKSRDQELANEIFNLLIANLDIKNQMANAEVVDLLEHSGVYLFYLNSIIFTKSEVKANCLFEMTITFPELYERDLVVEALKKKEEKIPSYKKAQLDELWLLIVVQDDIIGFPMINDLDKPLQILKCYESDLWNRIFLYSRLNHSFKEVISTNQIDSIG